MALYFFQRAFIWVTAAGDLPDFSEETSRDFALEPPSASVNFLIWGILLLSLGLVAGAIVILARRLEKREKEAAAPKKSKSKIRKPLKKATPTSVESEVSEAKQASESSLPKSPSPAADLVITSQTRERMDEIFSSVRSLASPTHPQPGIDALGPDQLKEILEDSEIVAALAKNLVSPVSVEESAEGKYSKMTLDGELLFDEEEAIVSSPTESEKKT